MKRVLQIIAIIVLAVVVGFTYYMPTLIKNLEYGDVETYEDAALQKHPLVSLCSELTVSQIAMSKFRVKCKTEYKDFSVATEASNPKQVGFYDGFDVSSTDKTVTLSIRKNNINYFKREDVTELLLEVFDNTKKVLDKEPSLPANLKTWASPSVKGDGE